jgi:hypothetical protein
MRTLLVCCLMLTTVACFAQAGGSPSVVMGQNAAGANIITTVIPLKFLDPLVAADLGTVIPVNPPHRPGESIGAYQGNSMGMGGQRSRRNAGSRWGNTGSGNNGYGGYQDAQRTNQQYPGYQSPYDYR